MDHFVKRPLPVTAFVWNGKAETVKKNVPKQDLSKYFRCFNTISGMELEVYTYDEQTWENPPLGSVIVHNKFGYSICNQKKFLKLYKRVK